MSGCKKKVGVVICGFGRAGQIHFNGVRKNCRCKLLYVVDRVEEDEAVKNLILNKLEQTLTEGVKVVGLKNYENVRGTYMHEQCLTSLQAVMPC